jgi:hypothetical protein
MALLVAELVDADPPQADQPLGIEPTLDHPPNDRTDRLPGDPEQALDLGLVGDLGQVGGQLFEGVGEPTGRWRPRYPLDPDAAPTARHPPRRVEQLDRASSPRQVSPSPHRPTVVARSLPTAPAAARSTPARANADGQRAVAAEQRRFDDHLRDTEQTTQYSGPAHGVAPPSKVVCHSQGEQEPHALSTANRGQTSFTQLSRPPLPRRWSTGAGTGLGTHSYSRRATLRRAA